MTTFVWFWLILGAVLLAAELVVPGMVLVFLGLGAWLVAAGVLAGLIVNPLTAFTIWFVTSLALILVLRRFAQRLFPADTSHKEVDEDSEFEDQVVAVVKDIASTHSDGRISLQGTTWAARALDEPVPAGGKARLLYRESLVWIVAPVPEEV